MKAIKVMMVGFVVIALCGCASAPPSSLGLYGDVDGPQTVKGSSKQVHVNRTMPYTADEVLDAAETALFRKGLNVEEKNAEKGRVTASGGYTIMCAGGPCVVSTTVAVYARQTSPKPTTRFTLLVDRHGFTGITGEDTIVTEIVGEIQKVLTTYE